MNNIELSRIKAGQDTGAQTGGGIVVGAECFISYTLAVEGISENL